MKGKTGKVSLQKLIPEPHGPLHKDACGGAVGKKHGGKVSGKHPRGRADKRARGGGIHIKPENKGKLHKELGVPAGEKIPAKKLAAAKNSSDPAERKRATFAANAKKWHH